MKKCFLSTHHPSCIMRWSVLGSLWPPTWRFNKTNWLLLARSLAHPFLANFCWVKPSPASLTVESLGIWGIGYWGPLGLEKNQRVLDDLKFCLLHRRKGWHAEDQVGRLRSRVCQNHILCKEKKLSTSNKQTNERTKEACNFSLLGHMIPFTCASGRIGIYLSCAL
jgi:hypothetical protein